jgi:hypothetical protein
MMRLHLDAARSALACGDPREGERLALNARAVARREGDVETVARATSVAVLSRLDAGDGRAAVRYALGGVRAVDAGEAPAVVHGVALADLFAAYVLLGANGSAEHACGRALRVLGPDDPAGWRLRADRGWWTLQRGDAAGAVRELVEVVASPVGGLAVVRAHLALALVANGYRARAEAAAHALACGERDAWVSLCLARVWSALGASGLAKAEADRAARTARLCGRSDWRREAAALVQAAEALSSARRRPGAARPGRAAG